MALLCPLRPLSKLQMSTKKKQTKAQIRVAIARDVLKRLDTKKLKAANNGYLNLKVTPTEKNRDSDFKSVLARQPVCTVCAIGGLFVSCCSKFNELPTSTILDRPKQDTDRPGYIHFEPLVPYLENYFSAEQLALVETAFEGSVVGNLDHQEVSADQEENACAIYYKHPNRPTARLRAIMQNIIDNDGTFVP